MMTRRCFFATTGLSVAGAGVAAGATDTSAAVAATTVTTYRGATVRRKIDPETGLPLLAP
jgi:hypothetical protein